MASLTKPTLQNANITQRLIFNNFDSKSSFLLSRLEPFRASFAGNVNIHRNVYRQVDGLLLRALGVDSRAIFGRECSWEYFFGRLRLDLDYFSSGRALSGCCSQTNSF